MGSKACRWPCGCMSEGLMYCGQNVTALSNKTENFWMWNLAEVVSSQTCRTGCAENQEGPKGSGRERCSINTVSSSRGKEIISGPFEDELAVKQKTKNYGSMGGQAGGGEEELCKCGWGQLSVIWPIWAPTWWAWVLYSSPNSTPGELGPNTAFHWISFSSLVK